MHIYGKTDIEANQDGFSLIKILIAILAAMVQLLDEASGIRIKTLRPLRPVE